MRLAVPALLTLLVNGSQEGALRVLRASPEREAGLTAPIMVTFDRPVAGSLDRMVDPKTILTIRPAVAGNLEWRDPITLVLRPSGLLQVGATYTVNVANSFTAMDGSRMAAPYEFSFIVRGPEVIGGSPVFRQRTSAFLEPGQTFELVTAAPVDGARLAQLVSVELDRACGGRRTLGLRVEGQRSIRREDTWEYKEAGGWQRDRSRDSLRRVVTLRPEAPLPLACAGALVVPGHLEPGATDFERWSFSTYGPLRLQGAGCGWSRWRGTGQTCPTGPAALRFSTPVRGSEILAKVKLMPAVPFTVRDTADVSPEWTLEGDALSPRTGYAVVVDTTLRDVFGQRLTGNPVATLVTTGYAPSVTHPTGKMLVERNGYRTVMVNHVNVDTLLVTQIAVPESLEAAVLAAPYWNQEALWPRVAALATTRRIPVTGKRDVPLLSAVRVPAVNAAGGGTTGTLTLLRVENAAPAPAGRSAPLAVLQVTDLAIHARIGADDGSVWVTGVSDGKPRSGVAISFHDPRGRLRGQARTDASGLARLTGLAESEPRETSRFSGGSEGYIAAALGPDRALVAIDRWGNDLSPWRFNVSPAYGVDRLSAAAAVFTERGIYRPGETVHAKAIVRTGRLGALVVPAPGDSVQWTFKDRDGGTVREVTVGLSTFGTSEQALDLAAGLPLGRYEVGVALKRGGEWAELATASYRVAEYRPPEFLVDVSTDSGPYFGNDSLIATVEARYLFGAPMARAAVTWDVRQRSIGPWAVSIPGHDGWYHGETGWWWEDDPDAPVFPAVIQTAVDTLDDRGRLVARVKLPTPARGRPAATTLAATVTDVNRQTVFATATVTVHPAAFYLAAKPLGQTYFWTAGQEQRVAVVAVRPTGQRVAGVPVSAAIVRREWHRVQRARGGWDELVGEWVSDTVARCALETAAEPVTCTFRPERGGSYILAFSAKDASGRTAATSFYRWAAGKDWVPWSDETQFKMEVIPDKARYAVGDTATIFVAAPFTGVEAWLTVEREGILEDRRLLLSAGATTFKLPITERLAPNAFVSVLLARGRSAAPGTLADAGRPTIRVGYAELRVTPESKRLAVELAPLRAEYRPGDTARVRLRVRDAAGAGRRAEVTLWAVDEGVLALTGYKTPDPLDLVYQRRALGVRLASGLSNVVPQVAALEAVTVKAQAPGGSGGAEGGDVLRSRFSSTAFFLGAVVTDANGEAVATAKLPDNLTTFRVMGVAVTAGDRYGSGQSALLVTRPLLARPALPRFLRREDEFTAGVVVNQRLGGTPTVRVIAEALGVTLRGSDRQDVTLAAGRGSEVRFTFRDTTADTATFRFRVTAEGQGDAVERRLPVQPAFHLRSHTAAGVLRDTTTVELRLPGGMDLARSRLELSLGGSPLAVVRGASRFLRLYPYYCSEQVASVALPLAALLRAEQVSGDTSLAPVNATRDLEAAVATLQRRQRANGGIGLWGATDWTTPWLSAHAGETLLEARAAGVAVSDTVLARLADYLRRSLQDDSRGWMVPVSRWHSEIRWRLAERVAAADFLSRLGKPDLPTENDLLRSAPQMAVEDRLRLAEILARRGGTAERAARQLLGPVWADARIEGRRAVLKDSSSGEFYFPSPTRLAARLLTATLAVDSTHALVGPLVETLIGDIRSRRRWWNTQDWGNAIGALTAFDRRRRAAAAGRVVRVVHDGRTVLALGGPGRGLRDSTLALSGIAATSATGTVVRVQLAAGPVANGPPPPVYWFLTVHEIPIRRPLTPDQEGVQVERWYEDYRTGRPVTGAVEGDLVRVRLRITLPAERQFLVLDDPLPAGLEAIDLSLRTTGLPPGPAGAPEQSVEGERAEGNPWYGWYYGSWDSGWWSPFDHRELRDDRVVYAATYLWQGTYTATYLARATTPGTFILPPAHAEEMYNPAVRGRSGGGTFIVTPRGAGGGQ